MRKGGAQVLVLVMALVGCGSGSPVVDAGPPDRSPDVPRAIGPRDPEAGGRPTMPEDAATRELAGANDRPWADGAPLSQPAPRDAAPPSDLAPPPAACPGPEAYLGDPAWRDTLVIPPGLRRCGYWVESDGTGATRLKQTLARKTIATVAAGSYKVIDGPGPAPFALPFCFQRGDGKTAATGTGTIRRRAYAGSPVFDMVLPLPGQGVVRASAPEVAGANQGLNSLWLCQDETCAPGQITFLMSCAFEGFTPERHSVVFDGGQVEVTVAIDRDRGLGVGTEGAEFQRATGTFRGTSFDQRDYWKLIYSPEHHHFVRHFAVLFDDPIAGACGLELTDLGRPGVSGPSRVFTVDCQLERLAELPVTSATF